MRPAAVLGRLLPPGGRRRAQRGAARGRQRRRRGLPLAHAPRTTGTSCASRSATRRRPRTTSASAWDVLQARGRASGRRRGGERLMRVLVLQHIACEPPGVFEDVLLRARARARARRARRGRAAARGRVGRDRRHGRADERERRGRAPLAGRPRRPLIAAHVRAGRPFWGSCLGAQLLAAVARRARLRRAGSRGRRARGGADGGRPGGSRARGVARQHRHAAVARRHVRPAGRTRAAGLVAGVSHQAFRVGRSAYAVQFHIEVTEAMGEEWAERAGLRRVRRPRSRAGRQRPAARRVSRRLAAHAATRPHVFERWCDIAETAGG